MYSVHCTPPCDTSILHIINEMGDVVKASEEDRRESLKSATPSFEDADENVKKGTFMEFVLDARRSLSGVVKCIHKFTLSKNETIEREGRFLHSAASHAIINNRVKFETFTYCQNDIL